jgi:hypothetical protein
VVKNFMRLTGIHVAMVKGKGQAENDPCGFLGAGEFTMANGEEGKLRICRFMQFLPGCKIILGMAFQVHNTPGLGPVSNTRSGPSRTRLNRSGPGGTMTVKPLFLPTAGRKRLSSLVMS